VSGREGDGDQVGRLLRREERMVLAERCYEVGLHHISWPLLGQVLEHPLDARTVGVAHELLDVDADVHQTSRRRC
jgi:hypothetical protein